MIPFLLALLFLASPGLMALLAGGLSYYGYRRHTVLGEWSWDAFGDGLVMFAAVWLGAGWLLCPAHLHERGVMSSTV